MPSRLRFYVEAARPRTLPAALAPVLVGTAATTRPLDELDVGRALLALIVALSLQVAVNYANDLFDGLAGIDTAERAGPRRAVASGLITPKAMKVATALALGIASVAGLVLAWLVGWELLLVGVLAVLATLGYSGGAKPYASRGLGEVMVFIFFGLVATVGSAYVQDEAITLIAVLASLPPGLLAVALLVVNNLRDIPTDEATGKRTLAVRLGEGTTRRLYQGLVIGAFAAVVVIALAAPGWWPLIGLLPLPLAWRSVVAAGHLPLGRQLIPVLGATGRAQLLVGVGLAIGLAVTDLETTTVLIGGAMTWTGLSV